MSRRFQSSEGMDPPLRKRLADLEKRRNTLIEAMSKFQDAKKSALFQFLNNENRDDDNDGPSLSSSCHGLSGDQTLLSSRYRPVVRIDSKQDRDAASSYHSRRDADLSSRTARSLPDPRDESVRSHVSSDSLRKEQRSFVLTERRQTYQKRQCVDECSTHTLRGPPSRKQPSEESMRDRYFGDDVSDGAPSDEVTTHERTFDDRANASRITEQYNNTAPRRAIIDSISRHGASKTLEYSRDDNIPTQKNESDAFSELRKSIDTQESTTAQGKHPIIARLRKLKEMNKAHSITNTESKLHASTSSDRRDNTEPRSIEAKISNYEANIARNKRRNSKTKVDDRFRKIFVNNGISPTNENNEDTNTKSKTFNEISPGQSPKELPVRNDLGLGKNTATSKENNEAPTTAVVRTNSEDSGDQMALLEKKLNMMISKKPLWQKALEGLYQQPFDNTIAVVASSSGSTKQPSEAETICSSDASKSISQRQKSESTSIDSGMKLGLDRDMPKNVSNDIDSDAETDTLESWRINNSLSTDSPDTEVLIALASRHLRDGLNNVGDDESASEAEDDKKVGTKGDGKSLNTAQTPTIESVHIQSAQKYMDNLPECLSGLYDGSTIGEKKDEDSYLENQNTKIPKLDIETMPPQATEIEEILTRTGANTLPIKPTKKLTIRTTPLQLCASNVDEEENQTERESKDEYDENDTQQLHLGSLPTAESSASSIPPMEEEWVTSLRAGFLRSLKSQPQSEEREVDAEQQQTSEKQDLDEEHQILTIHSQLNHRIEVEIETPKRTSTLPPERTLSNHSVLEHNQSLDFESDFNIRDRKEPTDEQREVSRDAEGQQRELVAGDSNEQRQGYLYERNWPSQEDYMAHGYGEQQYVGSLEFESYEQVDVEDHYDQVDVEDHYEQVDVEDHYEQVDVEDHYGQIDVGDHSHSLHMNRIADTNSMLHNHQNIQNQIDEQRLASLETDSSSCEYVDVEIDYRRMTQIDDTNVSVHNVEIVPLQVEQELVECLSLESNHYETDEALNKTKDFDVESMRLYQQNSQSQEPFIETDNFVETTREDYIETHPTQDQVEPNNSIFYDCVSELSDGSTMSLEVSATTGANSREEDGFDSDDESSEESSTKPKIPNEVTMLTDFTVQSITYASNSSNVESLGEESIVQKYQTNRRPSAFHIMSSNSESTVVAEKRRKKEKKHKALQVARPSTMTCSQGLLTLISNPTLLCQCTGPVALEAVMASSKISSQIDGRQQVKLGDKET